MKSLVRAVKNRKGLVLLPIVLAFGFILVAVSLVGLLVTSGLNYSNYTVRLSSLALNAARAGVEDSYLRIIRNNTWPSSNCTCSSLVNCTSLTYTLPNLNQAAADVCVNRTAVSPIQYQVDVLGTAKGQHRQLRALIESDATTGQARLLKVYEVEF